MVGRGRSASLLRVVTENSPDRRPKSPQSIPTNRQALYEFKTPQIVQNRPVLVEIRVVVSPVVRGRGRWSLRTKSRC